MQTLVVSSHSAMKLGWTYTIISWNFSEDIQENETPHATGRKP